MNRTALRLAGAASLLLVLASCETATRPMAAAAGGGGGGGGMSGAASRNPVPPAAPMTQADTQWAAKRKFAERPGLGTKLGGEIYDRSEAARFYRRLPDVPDAVATFHYNDEEGAKVMAQLAGTAHKHGGDFTLIPGKLEAAVEPRDWGDAFDHYESGGKVFVIGRPGGSYRLRLHNLTSDRLEVVVSIDGLDVLDGQPASVRKRGYVIDKHASITIEGMRVKGTLRELRFSTVAASHAATAFGEKGARNVGVIGVACYAEDETARRRANIEEGNIREGARAFGG